MLKIKQVFAIGIMTFIPFSVYAAPAFKAPLPVVKLGVIALTQVTTTML